MANGTSGRGVRPPQMRALAFSAAGGGFGGALIAIIVAKILQGPCCCCTNPAPTAASIGTAGPVQVAAVARFAD